ncbi:uncharacterized protein si:ch73-248e21.5 isoform X4 [Brienomyrus brachyistius]|uniref:uncharacterized protein si:ch73-248e21.5 isoform X4 n=1 Tax=Brienomyrus brachyistius TaxID=42636 RepID=UPI0020B4312F|nr:uncharacterized protein si:ch73-248e21.5 isoform X4 [Brienomyrus brachyistius]
MSLLQPLFITSLLLCFPAFHTQQSLTTNSDSSPRPTTDAPKQLHSISRAPEPSTQFASVTLISKAVESLTEPGPESSTSEQFLESSTAPTIQPTAESVPESPTTAIVQPTTETVPESSTAPTIQPTAESLPESPTTAIVQPTTEPVPESSTAPTIQPTAESVPESSTAPTIQPTAESLPESSAAPTIQPTTESDPESSTSPTIQPTTEPVPESSTTPIAQPITEHVPELSTVPITQPTTELISEISSTPTAQTTAETILGKTSPQGNTLTIIGKPSTLRPVLLPESSTLETSSFKATMTQTVPKSTSQNIVPLEAKVGVNNTGMQWKTIVIVLILMAGIATIACVLWGVSTTGKSKRKSDGEWDVCGGDRADGGEDRSREETVRDEFGSPGLVLVSFIPKDSGVGAAGTKEERRWNEMEALLFIDEDPN